MRSTYISLPERSHAPNCTSFFSLDLKWVTVCPTVGFTSLMSSGGLKSFSHTLRSEDESFFLNPPTNRMTMGIANKRMYVMNKRQMMMMMMMMNKEKLMVMVMMMMMQRKWYGWINIRSIFIIVYHITWCICDRKSLIAKKLKKIIFSIYVETHLMIVVFPELSSPRKRILGLTILFPMIWNKSSVVVLLFWCSVCCVVQRVSLKNDKWQILQLNDRMYSPSISHLFVYIVSNTWMCFIQTISHQPYISIYSSGIMSASSLSIAPKGPCNWITLARRCLACCCSRSKSEGPGQYSPSS